MTKFPLWKYSIIIFVIAMGLIYTIPNFYGDVPAVQISEKSKAHPVTTDILATLSATLSKNNLLPIGEVFDGKTLKLKFSDADTQLHARNLIEEQLAGEYIVAQNLLSTSPEWLGKINANPMFLGLDLRGGVHFLLEVDMDAAIKKTLDKYTVDIKRILQGNKIRYGEIVLNDQIITIQFRDNNVSAEAYDLLTQKLPSIQFENSSNNAVRAIVSNTEIQKIKEAAVKQDMLILHNRVNELGVAEPIIQQQGPNRIVVELPGIQDTARAKDIIGRIATLEIHLVNDDQTDMSSALSGTVPAGYELLDDISQNQGKSNKILIKKDVELTGDNITDAQAGFDDNGRPAVSIRLDNPGASIFKQLTGDNIGKRLAMVLVDQGKVQVVTAPVIKVQIGGGQVQISGAMDTQQANDTALLLRSGSLAAPMTFIEEQLVGPGLGAENIAKGFHSVLWGFAAITIFMLAYYMIFGVIAVTSLAINLLLLVAALSMLQATLTLPGIAAIALALGMAIDSNVLINERIREELRKGNKPHAAIEAGYNHAWATILDSNVTTLIAGLALLAFGSGSIKGFAVVHCLGILTSMFSAVFVSRGIVALLYAKRRINKLYIG